MNILGISAYYHDSAACLIKDGDIIAAAQEERFSRVKHDSSFPKQSIAFCLARGGVNPADLDFVVFYDKPFLKFDRLLETYLAFAPKGFKNFAMSMPSWLKNKLFQNRIICNDLFDLFGNQNDWESILKFSEHHFSHAASAYYPSPFHSAAILTLDGVGEWTTTSLATGVGNSILVEKEIHFPHSLGLLYSAFTYYTGFKVNSGEYKVMGLAPYGNPCYVDLIKDNLIDIKEDGSFHLDISYFDFCTGDTMTNGKFEELFKGAARKSEGDLSQRDMDLAASIQSVTEEVVIKLAKGIRKSTGHNNLCLAGGVALNCVANGKLLRQNIFDKIWIQPASGDSGGAIGAALGVYYHMLNNERHANPSDAMKGAYLGPEYTQDDIENRLKNIGAVFHVVSEHEMIEASVNSIIRGDAVGWHQGRMEFGPRALGGRSILADPRSPIIQKQLNLKVKYRESFRPFAPSVLIEHVNEWFDLSDVSPYMLLVADVREDRQIKMTADEHNLFGIEKLNIPRSNIPAVTHVDYSSRIQTVHLETNPIYYKLIKRFHEKTNCPIVVNTSFNVRGEPIVNTPDDAFNCFMGTGIEFLAIGNCILYKSEQNISMLRDYKSSYELD